MKIVRIVCLFSKNHTIRQLLSYLHLMNELKSWARYEYINFEFKLWLTAFESVTPSTSRVWFTFSRLASVVAVGDSIYFLRYRYIFFFYSHTLYTCVFKYIEISFFLVDFFIFWQFTFSTTFEKLSSFLRKTKFVFIFRRIFFNVSLL